MTNVEPDEPGITRLVVEMNRKSRADMAWLVEEEEMNKTTVTNRAIQLYRMVVEAQRQGTSVIFETNAGDRERLVIL